MNSVPKDAYLVKVGDRVQREPGGKPWLVTVRHHAGDTILLTLADGDQTESVPYVADDQVLVVVE